MPAIKPSETTEFYAYKNIIESEIQRLRKEVLDDPQVTSTLSRYCGFIAGLQTAGAITEKYRHDLQVEAARAVSDHYDQITEDLRDRHNRNRLAYLIEEALKIVRS